MTDFQKLSLEARNRLTYDTPLDPDSKLLVELNDTRGRYKESELLWPLGIVGDAPLAAKDHPQYILFGGHRGCGKSTELRRLAKSLHRQDRYFVIVVDALEELDITNLGYSDVLLALAKVMFRRFEEDNISLEQVHLSRLEAWFNQRIEKREQLRSLSAEIKSGATAKSGVPFLGEIFAALTNTARYNTSYKEEVRNVIRNSFSQLVDAFNALLVHAEVQLAKAHRGKKLLFIVDGTDRLTDHNSDRFFINEVHNLKRIQANFIYCAPIDLLSERGPHQFFDEIIRLPMIKIAEKNSAEPILPALEKLRKLVYLRMDPALFDNDTTLNHIICHSGGHIRDLIRLLHFCLAETQGQGHITQPVADIAIHRLATEYRRLIEQEDYELLVKIDQSDSDYTPINGNTRRLLYDLVLLEYNNFWWQSHPVVRRLSAYQKALPPSEQR